MPRLECPDCLGKGYVIVKRIKPHIRDGIFQRVICPKCKGSGLLPSVFTGVKFESL